LGYDAKDNGFMAFKNYDIPTISLLSRYVEIERKTGKFKVIGNLKILYSSMMFIRQCLIDRSAQVMATMATIILRYSNVRRQFKVDGVER